MKIEEIIRTLSLRHLIYAKSDGRWKFQPNRVIRDADKLHGIKLTNMDINNVMTREVRDELIHLKQFGETKLETGDPTVKEGSVTLKKRSKNKQGDVQMDVVMWLSPDIEKTDEYVMDVLSISQEERYLEDIQYSFWGTGLNSDGKELHNYAIKIKTKRKKPEDIDLADVVNVLTSLKLPTLDRPDWVDIPEVTNQDEMLVWHVTDVHFGSHFSQGAKLVQMAKYIVDTYGQGDYAGLTLALTGDILHADTHDVKTTRGTQLTIKGSVYDMYREAIEVLIETIAILGCRWNVDVIWTQGNHSRVFEFGMMDALMREFKDWDNITWDVDEGLRKAFIWGESGIALTHGDLPKKQQLHWFQYEFPEIWGKATNWTIIQGHTHGLKNEPLSIDGEGATMVRTGPALKDRDEYEEAQGYQDTGAATIMYIVHKESGFTKTELI